MNKKQQVIDIAIKLFAIQGYDNTSISAICDRAQVSKGLIFHHFKNKEDLLTAVFLQMTQIISDVNQSLQSTTAKERLQELLEKIFTIMAEPERQLYYQLNYQLQIQPNTRTILQDLINERRQLMHQSFVSILSEVDGIDESDCFVISRMMVAEIDGIALAYIFDNDGFPLDKVKNHFINKHMAQL